MKNSNEAQRKFEKQHESPDSSSIAPVCEDTLLSNENVTSTHKRRHSAAGAIYQSTTTQQVTTTTTKTKTKFCEADSTSTVLPIKYNNNNNLLRLRKQNLATFSNNGKDFFYHGKDTVNQMSANYKRNVFNEYYMSQKQNEFNENDEDVDDDDEEYLSDDSSDTSVTDKNDITEKDKDKYEDHVNDDEEDEEIEDDEEDDDDYDDDDEEVEEVEGERRWISNHQENVGIEFSIKKVSIESVNEEEQDRRSHFKVVKEFEKTLEFVKNASSLKVMNTNQIYSSCSSNSSSTTAHGLPVMESNETIYSSLKAPQISFASLCYEQASLMHQKDKDTGIKYYLI